VTERAEFLDCYARAQNTRDLCRLLGGCHHETAERLARQYDCDISSEHWGQRIDAAPDESEAIRLLEEKGFTVLRDRAPENKFHRASTSTFTGGSFRLGVVSDTHLGSKHQQLSHLHSSYDDFEREGIDLVLHAGDITTGNGRLYRGQLFDVFLHGADAQRDYTVENYPHRPGVITKFIGGNHDDSHFKDSGYDICKHIADEREDLEYLGYALATIEIHGIKVMLFHPRGPVPKTLSTRLQNTIDRIAPENKPHILIMGHLHSTCTLNCYRNVYGVMVGCFEGQTTFEIERGLHPEVGHHILDISFDENGVRKVKQEWSPYFVPVVRDY
jgi:predicted phosphodiesterase